MPAYRDLSAERRERAAARVNRHLIDLNELLAREGADARIVEGSAVAAEVFLTGSNTLHTAVRVAIYVRPDERTRVERSLRHNRFRRAEPAGDVTLLRLAARAGRRATHVLIEGDGEERAWLHPGDPRAEQQRRRRLESAWMPLASAYCRVRHTEHDDHAATESFEVQLIEQRP